jgi:uncharacterized membrane protein YqjE
MQNPQGDSSVWGAAKGRAVTLLAILQTRLELLGNEIEVGRITAMRQLMLALSLLFCVALGLVLAVVALTLLFWEQRLWVVTLAGALFWGLALYFYLAMRGASRKTEPLFAASLAELQEDLRQLKAASRHGPTAD